VAWHVEERRDDVGHLDGPFDSVEAELAAKQR
jgi:hypothetical protein